MSALFSPRIQQILNGIIRHKTLAHGYILTGPIGSFVNPGADYFAKSILCQSFENGPCETCASCLSIQHGNAVDYYPLIKTDSILIEDIRAIQEYVQYGPLQSDRMVVVIQNAEFLTDKSGNAFLKTLEEPPEGVLFILTTHNISQLLPTIRSRCQLLDFPIISDEAVRIYLNALPIEDRSQIESACFQNSELIKHYLETKQTISADSYLPYSTFLKLNPIDRLDYAAKISLDKDQSKLILLTWLKEISEQYDQLGTQSISAIEKLVENISYLKYNINLKLHLEYLFNQL